MSSLPCLSLVACPQSLCASCLIHPFLSPASHAPKTGRAGIPTPHAMVSPHPMPPILLAGHTSCSQPAKQAMSKDACAREKLAKTPNLEKAATTLNQHMQSCCSFLKIGRGATGGMECGNRRQGGSRHPSPLCGRKHGVEVDHVHHCAGRA